MLCENEKGRPDLHRMTTGELEELLADDLQTQTLSAEELLAVSGVLWERSPELRPRLTARESLARLRGEPEKRHRSVRRTMLIAAVLTGTLALSMLAGASGGDSIRPVVGAWDKYGFHFVLAEPVDVDTVVMLGTVDDPRWKQLEQTGHAPGLTPTWLPEEAGTSGMRVSKDEDDAYLRYSASYEYDGRSLVVSVKSFYNKSSGRTTISGEPLEVYCDGDVIYYIFDAGGRYSLFWFDGGFECRVMGLKTLEEAREVLRSVINGKDGK